MRVLRPDVGELVDRQTILQLKMEHGQSLDDPKKQVEYLKGDPDPAVNEDKVMRTVVKGASKINIKPFHDEHEMIQRHLEENWFPNIAADTERQVKYDELFSALLEVNGQLWKLEDQARILGDAPDKFQEIATRRAAEVLFSITNLNDKRADLVKQINALWNINSQEKMYA